MYMAKKHVRRVHHHVARRGHTRPGEHYLVVVRGWMLVVAFAIMLGIGAVVGQFINTQMNAATPSVAGVQIEAE